MQGLISRENDSYKKHFQLVLASLNKDSELLSLLKNNEEDLLKDNDQVELEKFVDIMKRLAAFNPGSEKFKQQHCSDFHIENSWVVLWGIWRIRLEIGKKEQEELIKKLKPIINALEKSVENGLKVVKKTRKKN